MKKFLLSLMLVSVVMCFGFDTAFADNHHRGNNERNESREYRESSNRSRHERHSRHDRHDKRKHDRHDKRKHDHPKHKMQRMHHPAPRLPRYSYDSYYSQPAYHNNLNAMLVRALRGCDDYDVWRVDYDTYVVRYRKGNRYYTRYVYPETGRYGTPALVTLQWAPMSSWSPIQIHINL
ncbi:MAG: hypothetical protein NC204_06455 [Candidatus Amulumruptor caecigallinarius]|nr:hypothetical protein [Candidatus Amulumruptor caecigallinarius]